MYQRRSSPRETAGAWTPGGATTRPSRISSQLGTHTASRPRASSPRATDRSFSINSKRIRRRQSRLLPPPRAGQSVFALPHLSFTLVKRSIPSPAVVPLKPVIYRGAQRYGERTSSFPISAGGSRGVPVWPGLPLPRFVRTVGRTKYRHARCLRGSTLPVALSDACMSRSMTVGRRFRGCVRANHRLHGVDNPCRHAPTHDSRARPAWRSLAESCATLGSLSGPSTAAQSGATVS
jgi:hypothetical protein